MQVPGLFFEKHTDGIMDKLRNPEASFAFACWTFARPDSGLPTEEAMRRAPLAMILPHMMVLRPEGNGDFLYEHYGAAVAASSGFDMTGKKVSDFKGAISLFFATIYAECIASRQPLATIHRLGSFHERPVWERVIMPVARTTHEVVLYVVNRIRELDRDIDHIRPREPGNGVITLQFVRGVDGRITDAIIIGANKAALEMTGRRLDELLNQEMRACFPGIDAHALMDHYIAVAETRTPRNLIIDYAGDGITALFDVWLAPFLDGVVIDFMPCQRAGAA